MTQAGLCDRRHQRRFCSEGRPCPCCPPIPGPDLALLGGADLVFEIPSAGSCQSAEHFARAGVELLDGLAAWISSRLEANAVTPPSWTDWENLLDQEPEAYREKLRTALRTGCSFPAARSEALSAYLEEAGRQAAGTAASLPSGEPAAGPFPPSRKYCRDSAVRSGVSQQYPGNRILQNTSPSGKLHAPLHRPPYGKRLSRYCLGYFSSLCRRHPAGVKGAARRAVRSWGGIRFWRGCLRRFARLLSRRSKTKAAFGMRIFPSFCAGHFTAGAAGR